LPKQFRQKAGDVVGGIVDILQTYWKACNIVACMHLQKVASQIGYSLTEELGNLNSVRLNRKGGFERAGSELFGVVEILYSFEGASNAHNCGKIDQIYLSGEGTVDISHLRRYRSVGQKTLEETLPSVIFSGRHQETYSKDPREGFDRDFHSKKS
jgi:hypothetical protein